MTAPVDSKIVTRVQALLAKAESTTFPEEAEALIAKAQELMTRYSIDEVLASQRNPKGSKPATRIRDIDAPYVTAKLTLLTAIAQSNNVRCFSQGDRAYLIGFDADLDAVEVLFGSLLIQATNSMLKASATAGQRVKAFRHAFLVAYAHRIADRLEEARRAAEADAAVDHGSALVPLLDARRDAVDDAASDQFPNARTRRSSISHSAGLVAGFDAADRAELGINKQVRGSAAALRA